MHITSGNGPEECAFAVIKTFETLVREAEEKKISLELVEIEPSEVPGNARSVLLFLKGEGVKKFAASWKGTIQWIWKSAYRPHHKRKNWFAAVYVYDIPEPGQDFKDRDVVFKTFKASGPGGQCVNKTDSAVRAIHLPSGKSAVAREARSQAMNKKLALARLRFILEEDDRRAQKDAAAERHHGHYSLERGNPVRTFRI